MAIVKNNEIVRGLEIRGRLGRPWGVGEMWCGWSHLGDENPEAGYYQRRPRKKGQIIVRMKHYWPDAGHTSQQLHNRSVFRDGINAWNLLTDAQKLSYNQRKYPRGKSGHNRFMTEYLRANL